MGRVRADGLMDPVGAEAHYARALEVAPGHAGALDALLKAARKRGDHARLAALLEQREQRSTDPKARLEMLREIAGIYMDKLGVPEAAVAALERAAELAPDDSALLLRLGNLHYDAGRGDEAAARYERVVELSGRRRPKDLADVTRRLARIREQQGDRREALRWYEEAHALDATDGSTLAALGRIYLEREDWEKARRIYRAILLGNLDEAAGMGKGDVYYNLGRIHAHLGETAKALGMYERGLEIEPDSVRLRKAMEALRAGR
jgi:tetratricopeptide (TPR) repeat protein